MATGVYDATLVGVMPATGQKIAPDTRRVAEWLVRGVVFALYALLFLFTMVAVGFIEIRQTNMAAFNSLIATLEQRDAYRITPFDALLTAIRSQRDDAQKLLDNLNCPKSEPAAFGQTTMGASAIENAAGETTGSVFVRVTPRSQKRCCGGHVTQERPGELEHVPRRPPRFCLPLPAGLDPDIR